MSLFISIYRKSTSKRQTSIIFGPDPIQQYLTFHSNKNSGKTANIIWAYRTVVYIYTYCKLMYTAHYWSFYSYIKFSDWIANNMYIEK